MLPINEYRDAAEIAVTVAAAVETGLMRALADGPITAEEAARRAKLDPRATGIVLEALADVGLLVREGKAYEPTEDTYDRFVDPESPEYAAKGLPLWLDNLSRWVHLAEVLRTGRPTHPESEPKSEAELAGFLAGMDAGPPARKERIVRACRERVPGAESALDLGGGPGHLARALVESGLTVTMVERKPVVAFGRKQLGLGEVEGLTLAAGDFMRDPLPAGPFDIVLVSNVMHVYGPDDNRALLRKVHGVVKPGGIVAIADFLRDRSMRGRRFAVVMLLRTAAGNTYREAEYRAWLEETGFGELVVRDVDVDRQIITARKLK